MSKKGHLSRKSHGGGQKIICSSRGRGRSVGEKEVQENRFQKHASSKGRWPYVYSYFTFISSLSPTYIHFLKVGKCEEKISVQHEKAMLKQNCLFYYVINRLFWKVVSISNRFCLNLLDVFKFSLGKLDFTHPANHWSLSETKYFSCYVPFLHLANNNFCLSLVFYEIHPK